MYIELLKVGRAIKNLDDDDMREILGIVLNAAAELEDPNPVLSNDLMWAIKKIASKHQDKADWLAVYEMANKYWRGEL